jgi:hypothetical protein
MDSHQWRRISPNIALHQRKRRDALQFAAVLHRVQDAVTRAERPCLDALDQPFPLSTIADERVDGYDSQAILGREFHQLWQPLYCPIVVHELCQDAGGRALRQTRQIQRSLRMAGADQHAAFATFQREYVAGPSKIVGLGVWIDQRPNGP